MASFFDKRSKRRPASNPYTAFDKTIRQYISIRTERSPISAMSIDEQGYRTARVSQNEQHFALDTELATIRAIGKTRLHAAWRDIVLRIAGDETVPVVDPKTTDKVIRECGAVYARKQLHRLGWYYSNRRLKAKT